MEKLIRKYQVGGYTNVSRKDLKNAARTLSSYGLKALSWLGDKFNSVVTSGGYSDMGQTSPFSFSSGQQRRNIHAGRRKAVEKTKQKIAENSVYISPSSYIAALTQGSINPKVGAKVLSKQSPEVQLLAAVGDITTLSKGPKLIKKAPATADKVLARTGNKNAKARTVAREIDKGVQESTKNGRIEVTDNYFNSPNNWYRIANKPEKLSLEIDGKNITTRDSEAVIGTPDRWRTDMQETFGKWNFRNPNLARHIERGTGENEGYFVLTPGIRVSKTGSAHGNTSQASKGIVWQGTTSGSNLFPEGIIEGQAPLTIPYGQTRTLFVNTPWEEVPVGSRIGFHTGEMPMQNLGWFEKLSNGRYTYEPIIPAKIVDLNNKLRMSGMFNSQPYVVDYKTYPIYRGPKFSVNYVVNPDGTVNPRQAMIVQHTVSEQFPGSYKMENRFENSRWHKDDPTTYDHTRNVAQSAWLLPIPEGFTKQDQMIAALGHDFGKMISGSGHAQIGADLARQVFPNLTEAQYRAIAEHMGQSFSSTLGEVTKAADITNGRPFNYLQHYAPELYNKYFGNNAQSYLNK